MFKEMANKEACQLLESGPVVMVTTRAGHGTPNVRTMGFHMMMLYQLALTGEMLGNGITPLAPRRNLVSA
jgi:hypothetical protein